MANSSELEETRQLAASAMYPEFRIPMLLRDIDIANEYLSSFNAFDDTLINDIFLDPQNSMIFKRWHNPLNCYMLDSKKLLDYEKLARKPASELKLPKIISVAKYRELRQKDPMKANLYNLRGHHISKVSQAYLIHYEYRLMQLSIAAHTTTGVAMGGSSEAVIGATSDLYRMIVLSDPMNDTPSGRQIKLTSRQIEDYRNNSKFSEIAWQFFEAYLDDPDSELSYNGKKDIKLDVVSEYCVFTYFEALKNRYFYDVLYSIYDEKFRQNIYKMWSPVISALNNDTSLWRQDIQKVELGYQTLEFIIDKLTPEIDEKSHLYQNLSDILKYYFRNWYTSKNLGILNVMGRKLGGYVKTLSELYPVNSVEWYKNMIDLAVKEDAVLRLFQKKSLEHSVRLEKKYKVLNQQSMLKFSRMVVALQARLKLVTDPELRDEIKQVIFIYEEIYAKKVVE